MKYLWFVLLLLGGCSSSPPQGRVAYVVNHLNGGSAASKDEAQAGPGKSYSAEPCELKSAAGQVELRCGQAGKPSWLVIRGALPAPDLTASLGKSVSNFEGEVQLGERTYPLKQGVFTLQTLEPGVARGNFSARIASPPWEVVGSFVANTP